MSQSIAWAGWLIPLFQRPEAPMPAPARWGSAEGLLAGSQTADFFLSLYTAQRAQSSMGLSHESTLHAPSTP